MEIGSEFWLDDTSIEQKSEAKWISKFGNTFFTSSGRGAISLMLQEVTPTIKTVLLPSYICDSVILPFIKHDYTCYFYDIDKDLSPILETIEKIEHVGIFLHMGYFGFPTNNNLIEVIRKLKKDSTIIVEDITHNLFSDYKEIEENDYNIASLRKWMPLPSGGLLASHINEIKSTIQQNDLFATIRKGAMIIKSNYTYTNNELLKETYQKLFSKAEEIMSEEVEPSKIDSLSMNIINETDVNKLIERRINNFKILIEGMKNFPFIEPLFKDIPCDVCPIIFPVYINNNRNHIKKMLSDQQIYCPVNWSIPKQISTNSFTSASNIFDTILSIPCDQRYGSRDMDRIISVFEEFSSSI